MLRFSWVILSPAMPPLTAPPGSAGVAVAGDATVLPCLPHPSSRPVVLPLGEMSPREFCSESDTDTQGALALRGYLPRPGSARVLPCSEVVPGGNPYNTSTNNTNVSRPESEGRFSRRDPECSSAEMSGSPAHATCTLLGSPDREGGQRQGDPPSLGSCGGRAIPPASLSLVSARDNAPEGTGISLAPRARHGARE